MFVQAMARPGPPLRTGVPEAPLLFQTPQLSPCPVLSPWAVPARPGLSSQDEGLCASRSSGTSTADGLGPTPPRLISTDTVSDNDCSQQMAQPLPHPERIFLLSQRVSLSPDLGPLGLSVTLLIIASVILIILVLRLWAALGSELRCGP